MNRLLVFTVAALIAFPVAADAQKRCTKGVPCGNTCIAATKVCHVGTPSTRPTTPPTPARSDSAAVAPTNAMAWVASSRGRTYYRSGCSTANRLSPKNLIHFRTEEEAQRAGYRRSTSRGC